VTRDIVRSMKKGAVIIDFSIDQGGSLETGRPTTLRDPAYVEEGVVHMCVPNAPGVLPRTSTHAFNNAAWPYIRQIANTGLEAPIADMPGLKVGIATHQGNITNETLAAAFEAGTVE